MADPVVQFQLVVDDPGAAAAFHARLFGWTVDDRNALGYRQLKTGSIDGGVWPSQAPGQALVQLFVEVEDVAAHLARAQALGAKVMVPRTALPDGDVMGLLVDPWGLVFGLKERRRVAPTVLDGDPA